MSVALLPCNITKAESQTPQLRLVSIAYPKLRRGGDSMHTRSHRPRTPSQHRWHRLVLLADLYAGGMRFAVFRGNAGILALHAGAGVLGGLIVAMGTGGITLAIARIAFAITRSLIVRAIIAALLAVPATLAGYHVALVMAQIGVPSLAWREVFACLGTVFIGGTAWTRLAVFTEPLPIEAARATENGSQPALTAAVPEG
jgi:hypothetical protein